MKANDDCEEYYQRRAAEVTRWMEPLLVSTEARDRLFVDLLCAKVDRKAKRDEQTAQKIRDDMAGLNRELEANNERVVEAVHQAKCQMNQFVDGYRRDDCGDLDEMTVEALVAENDCLANVIQMRRKKLDTSLARVRSVDNMLRQKLSENKRIMSNATAAVEAADRNLSERKEN